MANPRSSPERIGTVRAASQTTAPTVAPVRTAPAPTARPAPVPPPEVVYMPTGKGPGTVPPTRAPAAPVYTTSTPGKPPGVICPPGYFYDERRGECAPDYVYTTMPVRPTPLPGAPITIPMTPAPSAQTAQEAILSAASGGPVMPGPIKPPAGTAIPSPEEMLVAGSPSTVGAPKGGGGTILVGAGAGFLVGGPGGAIVGALIAGTMSKRSEPTPVQGFGGFWSSVKKGFKKATKKVYKGVKALDVTAESSGIRRLGRNIDLTYSKGAIGQYTYKIARPAFATMAAGVTGGLSVLAARKGWLPESTFGLRSTATGYAIGAAGGLAIASGAGLAAAASSGARAIPADAGPVAVTDTPTEALVATTSMPEAPPATSVDAAERAGGGVGAALAGAGVGFVVGGPVGAVIGGVAGAVIGARK